MPSPITSLPSAVRAGDTLSFSRCFPLYPASQGWALSYLVVTPSAVYRFSATPNGDDFDVAVATIDTATWASARATLIEAVANSSTGQRFTLGSTTLLIQPNLDAMQTGGVDLRSHAQKMLDSIEAYLEARTPTTQLIMIDGKRLEHYPLNEILAMRDKYRIEVTRESALASGTAIGSKLRVRL